MARLSRNERVAITGTFTSCLLEAVRIWDPVGDFVKDKIAKSGAPLILSSHPATSWAIAEIFIFALSSPFLHHFIRSIEETQQDHLRVHRDLGLPGVKSAQEKLTPGSPRTQCSQGTEFPVDIDTETRTAGRRFAEFNFA